MVGEVLKTEHQSISSKKYSQTFNFLSSNKDAILSDEDEFHDEMKESLQYSSSTSQCTSLAMALSLNKKQLESQKGEVAQNNNRSKTPTVLSSTCFQDSFDKVLDNGQLYSPKQDDAKLQTSKIRRPCFSA